MPMHDDIMIRRAQRSDVAAILAISNHYAVHTAANFAIEPEPLDEWLRTFDESSRMLPWLAAGTDDGTVVGFAKASKWKGRCAYSFAAEISVYIDTAFQGRRLGRRLYEALFETLRRQGYRTLLAGITLPNEPSVRLHESMGMRKVAQFDDIGWKFDQWHTTAYWQTHLDARNEKPRPIRDVAEVVDDVLRVY